MPEAVLRHTAPGFEGSRFQPGGGEIASPSISSVEFSSTSQSTFSPKFQPSFVYLKGHLPHRGRASSSSKTLVGVELSVSAFEAVLWLPVVGFVLSVVRAAKIDTGTSVSSNQTPSHEIQVYVGPVLFLYYTVDSSDNGLSEQKDNILTKDNIPEPFPI